MTNNFLLLTLLEYPLTRARIISPAFESTAVIYTTFDLGTQSIICGIYSFVRSGSDKCKITLLEMQRCGENISPIRQVYNKSRLKPHTYPKPTYKTLEISF